MRLNDTKNLRTQPIKKFPVFNNWDVVGLGWYFVCKNLEIKKGQVKAFNICGNELAIYRGEDGKVRALDAYCPHMGTHLAKGKVKKNEIQCFFHHWKFNEKGECTEVPCQKNTLESAKIRSYQVLDKYESVWIYPGEEQVAPLLDVSPEVRDYTIKFGKQYYRDCHHHVTMINGIDPQHLKTVHKLDIKMEINTFEDIESNRIDFTLKGALPEKKWTQKLVRYFLGSSYSYSMAYDHANNGLLTLLKDVSFKKKAWPTLHMIFAYRPVSEGKTLVQPIFLTPRRKGLLGWVISRILIFMTKKGFYFLQGEDGEVYDNMRFFPKNLLSIDKPVLQYIRYVNKIKPSLWGSEGKK